MPAEMLEQFDNEGAGAGGGIEDLDAAIDQVLAEMLFDSQSVERIMKRTISPGV